VAAISCSLSSWITLPSASSTCFECGNEFIDLEPIVVPGQTNNGPRCPPALYPHSPSNAARSSAPGSGKSHPERPGVLEISATSSGVVT
jgi:hypothetical protein